MFILQAIRDTTELDIFLLKFGGTSTWKKNRNSKFIKVKFINWLIYLDAYNEQLYHIRYGIDTGYTIGYKYISFCLVPVHKLY